MNFKVIDLEGGYPSEHDTLDDAIEAAKRLSGEWFIEDWTGEVVWSHFNENRN